MGKHHSRLLSCTSHNRLGSLPTQLEISMIVLINNLPPILPRALSRYTFKASGWCILASLALSARCMAAPELPSPTFSSALRVDSSHPAGYYSSMSLNLITSNKIPYILRTNRTGTNNCWIYNAPKFRLMSIALNPFLILRSQTSLGVTRRSLCAEINAAGATYFEWAQ